MNNEKCYNLLKVNHYYYFKNETFFFFIIIYTKEKEYIFNYKNIINVIFFKL